MNKLIITVALLSFFTVSYAEPLDNPQSVCGKYDSAASTSCNEIVAKLVAATKNFIANHSLPISDITGTNVPPPQQGPARVYRDIAIVQRTPAPAASTTTTVPSYAPAPNSSLVAPSAKQPSDNNTTKDTGIFK